MNLATFLDKKKYKNIPLIKTKTGHFEFKASINGVKGRFILDTGASNTCVSLDLEEHFHLSSKETETKAAGAGALDIETKIAHNVELKIGKIRWNDWDLVLIDLSHVNTALTQHGVKSVEGIIGADLLNDGCAVIDYKKQVLYLKHKSTPYTKS